MIGEFDSLVCCGSEGWVCFSAFLSTSVPLWGHAWRAPFRLQLTRGFSLDIYWRRVAISVITGFVNTVVLNIKNSVVYLSLVVVFLRSVSHYKSPS